jgi:hypothetical protein
VLLLIRNCFKFCTVFTVSAAGEVFFQFRCCWDFIPFLNGTVDEFHFDVTMCPERFVLFFLTLVQCIPWLKRPLGDASFSLSAPWTMEFIVQGLFYNRVHLRDETFRDRSLCREGFLFLPCNN